MSALLNITKNIFKPQQAERHLYKHYHFLNTLRDDRLEEILLYSEGDHLPGLINSVKGKKILFLNDNRHRFVFKKILTREPDYLINYLYSGVKNERQDSAYYTVAGNLNRPPFKKGVFDLVICPLVLHTFEVDGKLVGQLASLLKNGGRIILALRHMQLEHLLFNQNPSQTGSPDNSFSAYYKILKDNHLFIEDVAEGNVDKSLKPFFNQEGEFDYYHDYQNLPLTLIFRAVKYVK